MNEEMTSHSVIFNRIMHFKLSGAEVYIWIEKPSEHSRYEKKREVARNIDSDIEYLSATLWLFARDVEYNYTFDMFQEKVSDASLFGAQNSKARSPVI